MTSNRQRLERLERLEALVPADDSAEDETIAEFASLLAALGQQMPDSVTTAREAFEALMAGIRDQPERRTTLPSEVLTDERE